MKKNQLLILILTVGVFGILNTEMGIIGILPLIATKFNVTVPTAGLLVSAFALVVAFAGPTMPLLFSKMNRKSVMLLALGMFVLSNIVSIFATNFTILLIVRIIPAFFHPVYVSMALTVAGSFANSPEESAKAVAKVFVGVSAGMVLGVPVTSFIATEYSFALAMIFFTLVNIIVFFATLFIVPSMPVKETLSYGEQVSVLKKPIMLLSILIVILLNGSIFGFYSYLSDFLETITHISSRMISFTLLLYGLANIVGNIIAGKVLVVNAKKTIYLLPFFFIGVFILIFLFGEISFITIILTVLLGILSGLCGNVNQFLVTDAGREAPDFSNGLFLTAANLGTTFGTFFCGMFITFANTKYTLIGSLIFLVLSIFFIMLRLNTGKN